MYCFRKLFSVSFSISAFNSIKRNAGHSKWANIRHIKAQKDSEKSKLFTKVGQQIRVAIHEGGSSDPSKNLRLEQVIEQAKRMNMPMASIQNIIKSTQKDKCEGKVQIFEIKGPGGCIILFEVFTSNVQRVKQAVGPILRRNKAAYSEGGLKRMFEHSGIIDAEFGGKFEKDDALSQATSHAIEAEAIDVKPLEGYNCFRFFCSPFDVRKVETNLQQFNYKILSSTTEYVPLNLIQLSDSDMESCAILIDKLEGVEGAVNVYDNIA